MPDDYHYEWDARRSAYVQSGAAALPDQLQTIVERRDYLAIRIEGKRRLGWQTEYDEREHRALCWALYKLAPLEDDGA